MLKNLINVIYINFTFKVAIISYKINFTEKILKIV